MRVTRRHCLFLWLLLLPAAVWPQQAAAPAAQDANERYRTPEGRDSVARGLGSPDRIERMQPEKLVAALGLKPGMAVADLGAGVGLLLPALSAAVGPTGKVYAQDIFPDFLERTKKNVAEKGLANVDFILGTEKDPGLPREALDLAVSVDSYHHFNYPEAMLAGIRSGLKPKGRLAIIDYYKRPDAMPGGQAMQHIRADIDEVVGEVEAAGFTLLRRTEHIPGSQYLIVFEKP